MTGAFAEMVGHNAVWIGTLNTGILLLSSFTMALAVHAARERHWTRVRLFLWLTVLCGTAFLGLKAYEYALHYSEGLVPGLRWSPEGGAHPQLAMALLFYYLMTGLHAVHMLVGLGACVVLAWMARRGRLRYHMPVENAGLYWHLVDIFWCFLYPMFYLMR